MVRADRNILQDLITAYQAGCDVDLLAILKHEPMTVPESLAEINGTLRTGNKSMLAEILTTGINRTEAIDIGDQSSTLYRWISTGCVFRKPSGTS